MLFCQAALGFLWSINKSWLTGMHQNEVDVYIHQTQQNASIQLCQTTQMIKIKLYRLAVLELKTHFKLLFPKNAYWSGDVLKIFLLQVTGMKHQDLSTDVCKEVPFKNCLFVTKTEAPQPTLLSMKSKAHCLFSHTE